MQFLTKPHQQLNFLTQKKGNKSFFYLKNDNIEKRASKSLNSSHRLWTYLFWLVPFYLWHTSVWGEQHNLCLPLFCRKCVTWIKKKKKPSLTLYMNFNSDSKCIKPTERLLILVTSENTKAPHLSSVIRFRTSWSHVWVTTFRRDPDLTNQVYSSTYTFGLRVASCDLTVENCSRVCTKCCRFRK